MDGWGIHMGNGGVVGNFRWLSWSLRGSWDEGVGVWRKNKQEMRMVPYKA